jgi:hypothetical protein
MRHVVDDRWDDRLRPRGPIPGRTMGCTGLRTVIRRLSRPYTLGWPNNPPVGYHTGILLPVGTSSLT